MPLPERFNDFWETLFIRVSKVFDGNDHFQRSFGMIC
jgi:hypothetical protein